MTMKRIAVVGSTTVDKIVGQNLSFLKMGGVTTYSGITYARHGIDTLAVSNIARQDQEINACLQKENIAVFNGRTEHTTHFVNHINSAGRRQRLPRKAQPISNTQIAKILKSTRAVHLGPLHSADIDMEAINLLIDSDLYVILDVQGYVRSVRNRIVYPVVSKKLSDALMSAHIVKANKVEYDAIHDFYQIDLIELMTRFKIEEFIVTLREKGGFVQKRSGEKIHYAADKIRSLEDPTGAGDVFLAAYIIERFFQQKNISEACSYAAKLVAQQIAGIYIKKSTLLLAHKDRPHTN
jgi:sugar/nucleoside kinase (ribokinase family)